jgi:ABC-type branched-subunit amino acid transport system ATPase component/branched-subunit amino acid ABC-type transport system permease component
VHYFLPFIIAGLVTGAVYGLAGIGLVLTYKTSGIFNFGYGSIAALNVFVFYFFNTEHKMAWPLAALISVGIFAPLLGLALEFFARTLEGASETIKVVSTVGLILIVEAIGMLWHSTQEPYFTNFLSQSTVRLLGVNVTWEQIIVFLFCVAASAVLYWFFRTVRLGVLMRGVVDNHELVSMSGDNPVRVRRWAWVIGTMFAAIAGLMLAPGQVLDGILMAELVFGAFGAAAIGLFSSLPLTFAGGLLLGIAGSLMDKYAVSITWLGGLPASLPFVVLFVVLIVTPPGRLARRRPLTQLRVRNTYHAPVRVRLVAGALTLAFLAIVPIFQATHIAIWSSALIDIILFLSLGLLVRRSGQISLCQLAFAAVGAAAFGHFSAGDGMPWLVALLLAALIAVPVGAFIAIPAVRVSGVFLALATLGFGLLAEGVFYSTGYMFGTNNNGISDPRPDVSIWGWNLSTDKGFYYLLLLFAVGAVIVVIAISRSRLGRLLEALADSPLALETQGANSSVLKVIVFCITAAMASMAGAFTGMLYHYGVATYFDSFNSIYIVAIVVVLAIGDPWYAVIGAIGYTVIPGYVTSTNTTTILLLLFGIGAVVSNYGSRAGTTPLALRALLDRLGGRKPPDVAPEPVAPLAAVSPTPEAKTVAIETPPVSGVGLVVRDLHVYFGGVKAVNGVNLEAPTGTITGLIGPNGAGKSTTFDACSGLTRPTSGKIFFHGVDVSREGPARRARRGLGRTFQRTELFNNLTVRQNVAIGREASMAGSNPLTQVFGSRHANQLVDSAVDQALMTTGTSRIADVQVGLLPIGQRRLVELARTLAGPFDLLLLDEPSSGLDGHETEQFGEVLRTVVASRGYGILLVEHDMSLVRKICDRIYVLDFGELIFEGTAEEMQSSGVVRAAYLGDVTVASGARHETVSDESPSLTQID